MLKIQNKSTKRIRIAQIILFLIQIVLTSTPFVWGGIIDPSTAQGTYTVLDMISLIGAETGSDSTDYALTILGICFILFILLPLVAAIFNIFDRFYNLKNVVSLICSGFAIMFIVYFIGSWVCLGAVVAILLYLVSFFLGVMGIFARYLNVENTADKAPK
jgi:hypothetical protein